MIVGIRVPDTIDRPSVVIPEASVLVVSDNNDHMFALRTLLKMNDDVGDMGISRFYVRIASAFVQVALRPVKHNLFELSRIDDFDELSARETAILEMFGTFRHSGRHARKIVERLMVILKIRNRPTILSVQRELPGAAIPCPTDALGRE